MEIRRIFDPTPCRPAAGAALIVIAALTAGAACHAQNPAVAETIGAAAEALGMVRGVQRRMDSINTVQFSATGTLRVPSDDGRWTQFEVANATVGISYYIPAMRWDMRRTDPDGEPDRFIHVVSGERAWNEVEPGVDATPAMGRAAARRRQIWLTPHGVIRAAVDAGADAVGVSTRDGQTTITVSVDGTPVTAILDANSRPERVEMTIEHPILGESLLEALYTGYKDWPILDVYFPSRIVHRLGGETTLDLTVTAFFQNPYVVFPTPEQLARSSQ